MRIPQIAWPHARSRTRVVVLGAGFGGLELITVLSDALGDALDITLIDKDALVFGFSKLDVMFGRRVPADVRHSYCDIVKPGVRFLQSTIRSIDPASRRTVTDAGTFEADVLVVALGADYDMAATPELVEGGHEFYSVAGASALREVLPRFERGPVIIGVCGKSFKCPPAPSETALLLHDYLTAHGRRQAAEIFVVMPFGTPIPPSPDTSRAILASFAERGITFVKDRLVKALPSPDAYKGRGSCYVEFGHDQVGRVDVDFLSGPKPTGTSEALVAEKSVFASSRIQRWFGRPPVAGLTSSGHPADPHSRSVRGVRSLSAAPA